MTSHPLEIAAPAPYEREQPCPHSVGTSSRGWVATIAGAIGFATVACGSTPTTTPADLRGDSGQLRDDASASASSLSGGRAGGSTHDAAGIGAGDDGNAGGTDSADAADSLGDAPSDEATGDEGSGVDGSDVDRTGLEGGVDGAARDATGGGPTDAAAISDAAPSGDTGASDSGGASACAGGSPSPSDVVVNVGELHQKISGFGASTAWGSTMSAGDADLLWSTTAGAGLSLHRVRIDYQTGQTSEVNIAKMAVAHGVKVWATPWTPPGADKTGGTGANGSVGGTLSNGQAFATFLAGFVAYMKGQGVDIYAVSAQNEPDATVTYESCSYTGPQLASFIGTYMGPALAGSGAKIIGPESQNWCDFPNYEPAIMNNASALRAVSIIATHEYGCSPKAYPEIAQAGKEFWATEIYDQATTAADPTIASGLRIGKLVHDALTIANMNAWHYWWVYSTGNGGLFDQTSDKPTKRLWVEGNFSRFVRPGYQRVGVSGAAPSGVLVSAYTNPADRTVVVVAINQNATAAPLSLFLSGAAPCQLTRWVTSAADDLAAKSPLAVARSRASVSLAAQSVTTFVGTP